MIYLAARIVSITGHRSDGQTVDYENGRPPACRWSGFRRAGLQRDRIARRRNSVDARSDSLVRKVLGGRVC